MKWQTIVLSINYEIESHDRSPLKPYCLRKVGRWNSVHLWFVYILGASLVYMHRCILNIIIPRSVIKAYTDDIRRIKYSESQQILCVTALETYLCNMQLGKSALRFETCNSAHQCIA